MSGKDGRKPMAGEKRGKYFPASVGHQTLTGLKHEIVRLAAELNARTDMKFLDSPTITQQILTNVLFLWAINQASGKGGASTLAEILAPTLRNLEKMTVEDMKNRGVDDKIDPDYLPEEFRPVKKRSR